VLDGGKKFTQNDIYEAKIRKEKNSQIRLKYRTKSDETAGKDKLKDENEVE